METNFHKINTKITAREVRLILQNGKQFGIINIEKALKMSKENFVDLVEIQPNATPPVVKLINYKKFIFKKNKEKKIVKKIKIKSIKFRPVIEDHDYDIKIKHIINFLIKKNKVKIMMCFRNRENIYQKLGNKLIQRIINDIKKYACVELKSYANGPNITILFRPK